MVGPRPRFTNSGTEAIDGALKKLLARGHSADAAPAHKTARTRILAILFHGRTFGALSVTATEKYRAPFEPLVPGVEFVNFNDVADLEAKFDTTVCAIILETIQGEGGIFPVTEEFWERARALASKHGALLIADEIQCGLGRTGRYFAFQSFLRTGYSGHRKTARRRPAAGQSSLITRFDCACRLACMAQPLAAVRVICGAGIPKHRRGRKLLGNVRARGNELRAGLEKLRTNFDFIKEVRGEGCMFGVGFP
jgi:acetylornithine aminotransferase/acetylornithine/N-succinyldiaminopimelate aminotransferase